MFYATDILHGLKRKVASQASESNDLLLWSQSGIDPKLAIYICLYFCLRDFERSSFVVQACLTGNNPIHVCEGKKGPLVFLCLFIILEIAEIVISVYTNLKSNSCFDNDCYVNNMVPDQ